MDELDRDSENTANDEDGGGVGPPRLSNGFFVSTMSIHSLTLLDSEDSRNADRIFVEDIRDETVEPPESFNLVEVQNQLEILRARKAFLEAKVESLKFLIRNANNNIIQSTSTCRRAYSDTLLTSFRCPLGPVHDQPATTTIASQQSIISRNPSPVTTVVASVSTPILFSLYARRGPNVSDNEVTQPATVSSHSFLILSHPTFGVRGTESNESIPNSDTGSDTNVSPVLTDDVTEECRPSSLANCSTSLPTDGLCRCQSSLIGVEPENRMRRARRRITQSIQEEIVNCWENPRLPTYLNLRHSYPSIRESSGWIYDEIEKDALEAMSDTSGGSLGPTSSGVPSTVALVSSSTTFDQPPPPDEEELIEYFLQPVPSLVWDYVDPEITPVTPEHPFPRRTDGRPPGLAAVMAYINTLPPPMAVDSLQHGSQIGRRRGFIRPITADSNSDRRDLGFRARLRSELFYNVLFPNELVETVDGDEEDDSEDDDQGPDNEDEDADDEDVDSDDEGTIEADLSSSESTESDTILASSSTSESSVDLTDGDGDADSDISTASSDPNVPQHLRPDWSLPSTTTIGGKYDYFRETQRPRPFPGHKFVVSVFGTEARQNNNRLDWVPTYADRLQSILTQYLEAHNQGTQTDMSQGCPNLGDRIPAPLAMVKPDIQGHPLKMSQAQMDSVNKVVSWSVELMQGRDSDEDSAIVAIKGDFDTSILTTRSCPGMSTAGDRDTGDQVQMEIRAKAPHESELISIDVPAGKERRPKNRKRRFKVFRAVCCCHHQTTKSDPELPEQPCP